MLKERHIINYEKSRNYLFYSLIIKRYDNQRKSIVSPIFQPHVTSLTYYKVIKIAWNYKMQ